MTAVPLTLYLQRRDRTYDDSASGLNVAAVRAATEAWYEQGLADGMEKAREAFEAATARQEEDWKSKLDQARRSWSQSQAVILAHHASGAIAASSRARSRSRIVVISGVST